MFQQLILIRGWPISTSHNKMCAIALDDHMDLVVELVFPYLSDEQFQPVENSPPLRRTTPQ
jgi:hypothetical protein